MPLEFFFLSFCFVLFVGIRFFFQGGGGSFLSHRFWNKEDFSLVGTGCSDFLIDFI